MDYRESSIRDYLTQHRYDYVTISTSKSLGRIYDYLINRVTSEPTTAEELVYWAAQAKIAGRLDKEKAYLEQAAQLGHRCAIRNLIFLCPLDYRTSQEEYVQWSLRLYQQLQDPTTSCGHAHRLDHRTIIQLYFQWGEPEKAGDHLRLLWRNNASSHDLWDVFQSILVQYNTTEARIAFCHDMLLMNPKKIYYQLSRYCPAETKKYLVQSAQLGYKPAFQSLVGNHPTTQPEILYVSGVMLDFASTKKTRSVIRAYCYYHRLKKYQLAFFRSVWRPRCRHHVYLYEYELLLHSLMTKLTPDEIVHLNLFIDPGTLNTFSRDNRRDLLYGFFDELRGQPSYLQVICKDIFLIIRAMTTLC